MAQYRYEIFVRFQAGDLVCLETAESIEQVSQRMTELASTRPADYALFDTAKSAFVKSPIDDCPVSKNAKNGGSLLR
jgi:hypothetical protein